MFCGSDFHHSVLWVIYQFSASVILLLISFSVLVICLFFRSSRFLVNFFCIFTVFDSILFPRSWVIFTTITLKSFCGRLPISTLFSCFLGFYLVHSSWTSESCSVLSNPLRPHGLYHPWNFLGQNTGIGSLSLHQGIFPTQGLNPGLPHWEQVLSQLSQKGHNILFYHD